MYAAKIDLLYESALLLAAVCLSLSIYVLSRGLGNKLNLAYSALTLAISVWAFSFFVANVLDWRLFESTHIITNILLAPLSLVFLNVMLWPEGWVFRWLLRLALATSLLLVPLVLLGLDRTPWVHAMSYYSPVLIIVANLYLFFSEAVGAVKPRGGWGDFARLASIEMRNALRRRNVWLYLGGVVVVMLSEMDRMPWMGRTLPAIGNLLLALYFYSIKDAVLLQSLMSPRRIVGRFLVNLVGALSIFLIIVLITTWVRGRITLFLINAFFGALVAAATLDPLRSLANIAFQTFFFKEAKRINALIQEAGKEIAGAFHGQAIALATGSFLSKALSGKMVSFYALDAEGKYFLKLQDGTAEENLPESLPATFPFMLRWSKARSWMPILDKELERESQRETIPSRVAASQLSLQALETLKSTLALPLTHDRTILGFATMSLPQPPENWDESWGALPLMGPFFERAGEALRELDVYARLRERDRLATIGEMAAGLAHEIRNPLGAIKGAAQVLEPKQGDPSEPFLKIIVEEVNRLNEVVTQFLDYAKPFQGKPEWAQLGEMLKATAERFSERFRFSGIDFRVQIPDATPQVKCQPALIGVVLTNLLENSYRALTDATRKSQKIPTVSLRLAHTIREGKTEVSLSVEDNGPGMSPEVMDKIFIPFFTQSQQGTGLGLSICQKIAEAHSGRMEASSVPGEGTLMTLRFTAEGKE
ncbi:MAG TPA: ATP-binding protein [Bdellovibrionota bacterium]|jgi:signal transduction histidine kinase